MSVDLERLRRWEDSGALWEVSALRPDSVTLVLLRCDGGEEVDRFVSREADVLALCRHR